MGTRERLPVERATCAAAAKGGHLEVLQWARENRCPWNAGTCSGAAGAGHLDAPVVTDIAPHETRVCNLNYAASSSCMSNATDASVHLIEGWSSGCRSVNELTCAEYTLARCMFMYTGQA